MKENEAQGAYVAYGGEQLRVRDVGKTIWMKENTWRPKLRMMLLKLILI
jgi:hypothetical protein